MTRKTIMIVDDDRAVLDAYARLLARLGHTIVIADDPERLRLDPGRLVAADLLILDHRMPRATGLDLLAALGSFLPPGATERPMVFLITAVVTDELRARAGSLGVDGIIEKPVEPARFLARVRAALDGAASEAPARIRARS